MKIFVTANQPRRCRAGHVFTDQGRVIDLETLTEAQQEAIHNDQVLHVREATPADIDGSPSEMSDDERDELISQAIKTLGAADFDGQGKPRMPAIRAALNQPEIDLTAGLRDTVFKAMQEDGFQKPTV